MSSRPRILVITPVRHIHGVAEILESIGEVSYLDDPDSADVMAVVAEYEAIVTNPNKSRVFLSAELMAQACCLQVICTASTGTNHIDKVYAAQKSLPIVALTEERAVISRISSTAELAFGLMLSALRHMPQSMRSVLKGEWDYTQFIGRQVNCLTVGVVGYGRLGSMFAGYCRAFGARVMVYDPYQTVSAEGCQQVDSLDKLLPQVDVLAMHVHVTDETTAMISTKQLVQLQPHVVLVNTARGDVMDEVAVVRFLQANPLARIATDVLADEVRNRENSPLLKYAEESDQVLITPHIGGMTRDAQEIAYTHAVRLLKQFFEQRSIQ
jgi:phosphoglycerate dehydrogenase-like enzyme